MRGCERKIIMLKGTDSEIFDEAYFLIRRDIREGVKSKEIVSEAQRIVDMNTVGRKKEPKVKKRERVSFVLGVLAGAAVCAILFILF